SLQMKYWILPLFILLRRTFSSECVVSPWAGWTQCFGDCKYGQQVRNRDVIRPPLPEVTSRGAPLIPICPHLYESRFCSPSFCIPPTTTPPRVRHRWHASTKLFRSWPSTKSVTVEDKNPNVEEEATERSFFIDPFPTLVSTGDSVKPQIQNVAQSDPRLSLQHVYRNRVEPQDHFTIRGSAPRTRVPTVSDHMKMFTSLFGKEHPETINQKTKTVKETAEEDFQKYFAWINGTTPFPSPPSSSPTTTSTSTSTTSRPTTTEEEKREEETTSPFIFRFPRIIPSTLHPDPFNEDAFEDITAATKSPNMMEVMQMLTTTITAPTEKSITTTTNKAEQSTTRGMWQRDSHFVPNTRQHASEITKQLYITGQIVQADRLKVEDHMVKNDECLESPRCCAISREVCPDGTEPIYVKRYYRPRGGKECVPYKYPRCDKGTEMDEQPIQFSQNCEDLCFPTKEKSIAPLFILSSEV
ncbi:hypothetical protein PENTCL1PPCAC_26712, partial [Pristionchus entomophagus]